MIRFKPGGHDTLYWIDQSGVESRKIRHMAIALTEDVISDAPKLDELALACAKQNKMRFLSVTPLGNPQPAPEIGPMMFWVVWECS